MGQGLGKRGRSLVGPSPDEVEGSLWGGQDVEGHRQRQALSEVGQVELGASKLPLHVSVILGTTRWEAMQGPCWHWPLACSLCVSFVFPS